MINSIIKNSNTSSFDNSLIDTTLDSCFNQKISNEEKIKRIQFLVFTINRNKNKLPLFPIIPGDDGNFTADQEERIKTSKICDKTFNDIVSDENLCYLLISNLLNRNLQGTNADDDMYAKCKIFANILAKDKNFSQKTSNTEADAVKKIKCIKDFIQILCGDTKNNGQFFFQSKAIGDILNSPALIYLLMQYAPGDKSNAQSAIEGNNLIQEFKNQNEGIAKWREVTAEARKNKPLEKYNFFGQKIENIFNSSEMSLCLIASIMEAKNCTASLDDMLKINNELQNKNLDVRNKIIVLEEKTNFLLKKENGNIAYTVKIEDNKIKLTVPNRIENLVFSGGGGKGLGYSKSINTLIKAGALDNVKNVAGSSAGALAATAVAIGLKNEALSNFVTSVLNGTQTEYENIKNYYSKGHGIFDLIKLNSKPSKLISVIPTIISTAYTAITAKLTSSIPLRITLNIFANKIMNYIISYLKKKHENFSNSLGIVQYIDTQTRETVSKFLNNLGKDQDYSNLTKAEQSRLNFLKDPNIHKDENGKVIESAMITFNDLTILSKLKTNHKNPFKELVITGWDNNHGKELYFNSENTPNMPVAYAARASMALPMAFCATQLNFGRYGGKYTNEGILTVKDGGLGSNIPVEVFINELAQKDGEDAKKQEKRLEKMSQEHSIKTQMAQRNTLAFVFDNQGESTVYNGGYTLPTAGSKVFYKAYNTLTDTNVNTTEQTKVTNNMLNYTANKIIVGHGNASTLTIDPNKISLERMKAIDASAEAWANTWLRERNETTEIAIPLPKGVENWDDTTECEIRKRMLELAKSLDDNDINQILDSLSSLTDINPPQAFEDQQPQSLEDRINKMWKDILHQQKSTSVDDTRIGTAAADNTFSR